MGRDIDPLCRWQVAGMSVPGISHLKAGLECQDAWELCGAGHPVDSNMATAVCVSDGAGSASKAFAGARLTAFAVSKWLYQHFPSALELREHRIAQSCLSKVTRSVRRATQKTGLVPSEYAATFVAVCVGSDGAWLALHLGDGGIIGRFGSRVLAVSQPEKGEFANETWFATSSDALDHIRVYGSAFNQELPAPDGFVLFSDGVENSLLDRRKGTIAHAASAMLDWFQNHPPDRVSTALEENISAVFRARSPDDCTIVLMAKPQERFRPSDNSTKAGIQNVAANAI